MKLKKVTFAIFTLLSSNILSAEEISYLGFGGTMKTGLYIYGQSEMADKVLYATRSNVDNKICLLSNQYFEIRNGWEDTSSGGSINTSDYYPSMPVSFVCPDGNREMVIHEPDFRNKSFSPINDTWYILNSSIGFYQQMAGELPMKEKITVISHYFAGENAQYVREDKPADHGYEKFRNHILISDGNMSPTTNSEYIYSNGASSDTVIHELTHAYTAKPGHAFETMDFLHNSVNAWSEHFSDIVAEYYQYKESGQVDFIHNMDRVKCISEQDIDCRLYIRNFKEPIYKSIAEALTSEGKEDIDQFSIHTSAEILGYAFYSLIHEGIFTFDELMQVFVHAEKHNWKPNTDSDIYYFTHGLLSSAESLGYSDKVPYMIDIYTQTGFLE
ncbi:hypothetical protein BS333_04755 [Vibrio azureus]|uniref:Peptidase M4 C-terminal domain-containing protein n=1 Tax=Vibrio azureus NBRC 104587 TaxID=1219077 RepID=U3C8V3_9VIBR|nr:hypothetical protein [Vibrio azureus]AUI85734.1 hypothetical protein BS333_04755 [Vibrio azureus]GAD74838.1 hypothetical protein VAZ01S_016_00220 [Vibrio azureus NBRC 104587]